MGHLASWEVLCLGDSLTRGRLGADWVSPTGMPLCSIRNMDK